MKIVLFYFFFIWKAIKIAGSAQKNRVCRVSGNIGIFFFYYFSFRPNGDLEWAGVRNNCLQ